MTELQRAVEEWRAMQDDLIDCPLRANMKLSICKRRQGEYPPFLTENSQDKGVSYFFGRCAIIGCKHYETPEKRKRSYRETRQNFRYKKL